MAKKQDVETTVREIRRKTRKKYSAEEKIRIVLEGLRGENTIAELCRPVVITNYSKSPPVGYARNKGSRVRCRGHIGRSTRSGDS